VSERPATAAAQPGLAPPPGGFRVEALGLSERSESG
jgi:hypothetical protein